MMNEQGVFIGQVCHIKAAENGGPRFSPAMTNEQRRAPANLMLMCYAHHQVRFCADAGLCDLQECRRILRNARP